MKLTKYAGYVGSSLDLKPSFSVITACFNSSQTILKTIQSVNKQDYKGGIEHIFIDGLSSDATIDIIEDNVRVPHQLLSEEDKGIYDAMNKGIQLAKNEWLCFMNSDDHFATDDVFSKIADAIQKADANIELMYGNMLAIRDGNIAYKRGRFINESNYWYPMDCVCHQAIFFKKSVFYKYGYFNVALSGGISDYVWLAKYFAQNMPKHKYVNVDVACFCEGGYSFAHAWESHKSVLQYINANYSIGTRLKYYMRVPKMFVLLKIFRVQKDTRLKRAARCVKRFFRGF